MLLRTIYRMLLLIGLSGSSAYAQSTPNRTLIDEAFYNNQLLTNVLQNLQKRYGAILRYDPALFGNRRVTVLFNNISVEDGLKRMVQDEQLPVKLYTDTDGALVLVSKSERVGADKIGSGPGRYTGKPERTNLTLTGQVRDRQTGESLPFATLYVRKGSTIVASARTNVDGYFTLTPVPSDTCGIYLSYVGYINTRYFLNPKTPATSLLIEMSQAAADLDEVVVTGEKTEVISTNETVSMIKMTPRNLAKLPNVGERDPFRAFQLMPGVSASNESSSGLYVRGGTPDQTLVLYDGFTVYHVDHLFGFFSAFNYNAIKDIQLYKGGFDARFGGRTSAVAEITGKEGNQKAFNTGADISLLSANAFLEAPLGSKATVLVAARRSWKGPLYNKIFNRFTESNNNSSAGGFPGGGNGPQGGFGGSLFSNQTAKSYFYDLNAKLTFRPTRRDIVALSLYNGTDNMDNSSSSSFGGGGGGGPFGGGGGNANFNTSTNDLSTWGNLGSSLKWSRHWNATFYTNALVSFSNYYSDRDNSRNINITRSGSTTATAIRIGQLEHNDLDDVTAKVDAEWKLTPANQVDFGGQYTQNRIKYSYSENDTITVLARDDQGSTLTAYVQDQLTLAGGRLQLRPGLRFTYFDVTGNVYTEPRLSGTYQINPQLKLKGAVGIYYQFVKQINREDISQGNRNFWILSNAETLPVTQSNHLILGGSYEWGGPSHGNYLFDVEFYQKQNTGVTEYTLRFTPRVGQGLTADQTFFNGDETVRGVDVLVQRKFGAVTGWLGYTFSEAKRNITAFSGKPYYSDQDVRHQAKVVGSYHYKRWDLAATLIYASGRPYTSIIGGYQVTALDGTTHDFTNPSDKNANRFPDYHRLDLSAVYTFNPRWNIGVSVFNVYNRTNTWYRRYQIIDDSDVTTLQVTNVNYLNITPNLTLSVHLR